MGRCVLANQVCPQTSDPTARRYCPAWWETVAEDDKGNQRVMKGCAWAQLPMYLNEFASKAAGAAEAAQAGRNELASLVLTLHSPVRYAQIAIGPTTDAGRPALPPGSSYPDTTDVSDCVEGVQQS